MAWTAPRTWGASELLTAAKFNTDIRDNENFLRTFHGARMWESAVLSQTANAAWQLVTFDVTDYDSDSIAVLGSDWFVVPTGFDGTWRVTAHAEWSANATGSRQIKIMKNETYTVRAPNGVGTSLSEDISSPAGGLIRSHTVQWTGPLVAGDHVTMEAQQNSGGNLAFDVGKPVLWFESHYLGS